MAHQTGRERYRAVMNCLLHALLPQVDARELYDTRNGWDEVKISRYSLVRRACGDDLTVDIRIEIKAQDAPEIGRAHLLPPACGTISTGLHE